MKRRSGFAIHSWLGVMAGLLMFVICWSGTIATVSHEIDWLLNPMMRVVPQERTATWGQLYDAVRAAYPTATAVELQAPLYRRFAAVAVIDTPEQKYLRVHLDPYRGTVLGDTTYFNVQRFFRSLHMSLFDPFRKMWGYWLVSAFGFLLLGLAITPLIFYRRWWRGFIATPHAMQTRRAWWSNMHKLAGTWALAFALLMGITGAWWAFEYAGVDLSYPDSPTAVVAEGTPQPLDALVATAAERWPELQARHIYVPAADSGEPLLINGQAEANLVRDRANWLRIDPQTGEILAQQRGTELAWPARWIDTVDPLHFGDFAGLGLKLVWFAFGLLLSSMALSGAYLHYERLQPDSRSAARHRWRGYGTGIAASALVLLLTVMGGWMEIRGYGPIAESRQQWPEVSGAVLAFIAAWVLVTCGALAVWCVLILRRATPLEAMRCEKPHPA